MRASETTLKALLDGQKQYIVPLFQRRYSWDKKHWTVLWQDLCELYNSTTASDHFLGSIVTVAGTGPPESVTPYTLIDGQQRLTTLCILLAALRDTARESCVELSERLHGLYLTNHYVRGMDRLKVLPTQADREAFLRLIDSTDTTPDSRITQAYRFFLKSITAGIDNGTPIDLERFESSILNQVSLVSISLGQEDNPYRIFESLNYKGLRLSQSDLLRNYFFMRLPVSTHEDLYQHVWRPMEDSLGKAMDEFIRDFLVRDGEFVRDSDVYQVWKLSLDDLPAEQVQEKMGVLGKFSEFYSLLLTPNRESDGEVAKALTRLNRWGGTTVYPFLLNLYEAISQQKLSKSGLSRILNMIESFLVRRAFANVPTNALNRIFIRLYAQLPPGDDLVDATRAALSSPGLRWPTDNDFMRHIPFYPLYRDSRPEQRKLILQALEESFEHKEPVVLSPLTVEHIMPQALTDDWRRLLGAGADDVHSLYLHTLGNLTLSGYNSPLSNHAFERKSQILEGSHLELNREISEQNVWGEAQIVDRANRLAQRALSIWPGPKALSL